MKPNTKIPQKTSSAEIVASIDDLLLEIFLRLPMKSLFHFKSVSKHWRSLISDPGFFIRRNPDPNPAVGLIFQYPDKFQRSNTDPWNASKPTYAYIVSLNKSTTSAQIRTLKFINSWPCTALNSCNGLLLCRSTSIRDRHVRYYVCNPTTNKYSTLPQTDERVEPWMNLCRTCLAFDPSKSPHYKVVCARKFELDTMNYEGRYQFEVYSSETSCWRKCGEPFTAGVDFHRGVYWNGAIHWISVTQTGKSLYFNPDDDKTPHVMPTPPLPNSYYTYYYFGESCGHLHYIDDCKTVMDFNVYEMRNDYSEWFVKYRVDCLCMVGRLDSPLCALVRGKKDEDSFLVFRIGGKLIRHNLVQKTCETICELESAQFEHYFSSWHADFPLQYIESLCSV